MITFRPSLSDQSFTYWATVFHKPSKRAQKPHSIFSVTGFVHVDAHNSAKGLSSDLEQFFCPPYPQILSSEYYSQQTRLIKPETFMDRREWQQSDYESFGYPGKEIEFYEPRYPIWCLLDVPKNTHDFTLPTTKILDALLAIGKYWHIGSTPAFHPRSAKEVQSGTMEAIGLGYLRHPLLPTPHVFPIGSLDS